MRGFFTSFWNAVWPVTLSTDTELQRRKKVAVRSAQLAVAAMVIAPVAASIVLGLHRNPAGQACLLALLTLAYVLWSWQGIREPVRLLFAAPGAAPAPEGPGNRLRRGAYFVLQLALAGVICFQTFNGPERPIAWLVLLPPVAHGVILLRLWGVVAVAGTTLAMFVFIIVSHYGWPMVPTALLAFPFALLFTLVFTLLAVSAERSRRQVECLAGELAEANAKLRQHAVQAEELAATRERNRLASEIHDSLGHYLTVVNVQLEAARALGQSDPGRAGAALAKAQSLTLEGLQEVRRSVSAFRASPLANQSLPEALRRVVEENRAAGLQADLEVLGETRRLSPQAELTLYRAAQEGLTNVRKHAQADRARLALDFRAPATVLLAIRDNGLGGAVRESAPVGFGLLGLRERAQLLGGQVRAGRAPDRGFTLEVEVPG